MARDLSYLNLETNDAFQRAEWRMQRIGWASGVVILVGALLGLIGPGAFSATEVVAHDTSLRVKYDRFAHYHNSTTFDLTVTTRDSGDHFALKLDADLLAAIELTSVEPEPVESMLTGDGTIFTFRKDSAAETMRVVMHIEPASYGKHAGLIGLPGQASVPIRLFIFP